MSDQRAREAALRRRKPNPEKAAERTAALAAQDDWEGRCRVCGAVRRGTIADHMEPCPAHGK